jgi:quercetin dioxygenase-like cupin family protein
MTATQVYRWSDLPPAAAGRALKRGVPGQGASLQQVEIPAGAKADRHSHDHEQFVIVVEGTGRLQCDAGEVELKAGTVIHFPPHAWHSAVFDTRTVLVEVNLAP